MGMMRTEERCRIVRIFKREHWFSRRWWGIFVALVPGRKREYPIARSATFAIPQAADAALPLFHAFLAQLAEEGWEQWRDPAVPLGIDALNHGYWSLTLRRGLTAPDPVDEQLTQWRARGAEAERMEALRARAVERFRRQGYQV